VSAEGGADDAGRAIAELLAVMARLRDPATGCPWDLAQSFATIAPYTLEEAYEVADAIESGDPEALRGELGDLLFQVVFHARMAEERGWFDFAQVASGIAEKLTRRHPHVFGGASEAPSGPAPLDAAVDAALWRQWEAQKEQERLAAARRRGELATSVLQDVPRALPALVRAAKLGKRAARVGFDWDSAAGVRDKVAEELRELDVAVERAGDAEILEELGDLLFALANWGRHLRVDAETALRAANAKFERRFTYMERIARERGLELRALSAADWEALWGESKQAER
jgi:nucleoside triphosphate diphosphatase